MSVWWDRCLSIPLWCDFVTHSDHHFDRSHTTLLTCLPCGVVKSVTEKGQSILFSSNEGRKGTCLKNKSIACTMRRTLFLLLRGKFVIYPMRCWEEQVKSCDQHRQISYDQSRRILCPFLYGSFDGFYLISIRFGNTVLWFMNELIRSDIRAR